VIRVLVVSVLVILVDQLSKLAVVEWMNLKVVGLIDVFPPFLTFRMAWNQGVNFGLFSNETELLRWFLVVLSVAISIWLIFWARRMTNPLGAVFAGFVVGGAIGNAIDRVVYGAVADFLNLSCCGLNNPYAFNIADIAIFFGAFGLVLFSNKLENNG